MKIPSYATWLAAVALAVPVSSLDDVNIAANKRYLRSLSSSDGGNVFESTAHVDHDADLHAHHSMETHGLVSDLMSGVDAQCESKMNKIIKKFSEYSGALTEFNLEDKLTKFTDDMNSLMSIGKGGLETSAEGEDINAAQIEVAMKLAPLAFSALDSFCNSMCSTDEVTAAGEDNGLSRRLSDSSLEAQNIYADNGFVFALLYGVLGFPENAAKVIENEVYKWLPVLPELKFIFGDMFPGKPGLQVSSLFNATGEEESILETQGYYGPFLERLRHLLEPIVNYFLDNDIPPGINDLLAKLNMYPEMTFLKEFLLAAFLAIGTDKLPQIDTNDAGLIDATGGEVDSSQEAPIKTILRVFFGAIREIKKIPKDITDILNYNLEFLEIFLTSDSLNDALKAIDKKLDKDNKIKLIVEVEDWLRDLGFPEFVIDLVLYNVNHFLIVDPKAPPAPALNAQEFIAEYNEKASIESMQQFDNGLEMLEFLVSFLPPEVQQPIWALVDKIAMLDWQDIKKLLDIKIDFLLINEKDTAKYIKEFIGFWVDLFQPVVTPSPTVAPDVFKQLGAEETVVEFVISKDTKFSELISQEDLEEISTQFTLTLTELLISLGADPELAKFTEKFTKKFIEICFGVVLRMQQIQAVMTGELQVTDLVQSIFESFDDEDFTAQQNGDKIQQIKTIMQEKALDIQERVNGKIEEVKSREPRESKLKNLVQSIFTSEAVEEIQAAGEESIDFKTFVQMQSDKDLETLAAEVKEKLVAKLEPLIQAREEIQAARAEDFKTFVQMQSDKDLETLKAEFKEKLVAKLEPLIQALEEFLGTISKRSPEEDLFLTVADNSTDTISSASFNGPQLAIKDKIISTITSKIKDKMTSKISNSQDPHSEMKDKIISALTSLLTNGRDKFLAKHDLNSIIAKFDFNSVLNKLSTKVDWDTVVEKGFDLLDKLEDKRMDAEAELATMNLGQKLENLKTSGSCEERSVGLVFAELKGLKDVVQSGACAAMCADV